MSINRTIKYVVSVGLAVALQSACLGAPKVPTAGELVLSPGTLYGSSLYNSWPLMLKVVLWREMPTNDQTVQPLNIKAKQGAWRDALVVTVKNSSNMVVKWPLNIVKQNDPAVTLGTDDSAQAEWWLTPEHTKAIPEGEYFISVAFDAERLVEAPAASSDEYCIRVTKEPSPLDAETKEDKELQMAHLALLQNDTATASVIVQKVLAADPKSIGGNRMHAILLDTEGKTREAIGALDTAMDSYFAKYPKACPPAGILSLRAGMLGKMKLETEPE